MSTLAQRSIIHDWIGETSAKTRERIRLAAKRRNQCKALASEWGLEEWLEMDREDVRRLRLVGDEPELEQIAA
jgi:hypothetical protein